MNTKIALMLLTSIAAGAAGCGGSGGFTDAVSNVTGAINRTAVGGGSSGAASGSSTPTAGQIVGGKAGQYIDAGSKMVSAAALGEAHEDGMGQTVAIAATNKYRVYDKPELTKYVNLVGLTVASASARPDGHWLFGVLDTPQIAAYSGPNGYIFVTRGAIAAMEDEAELAGVLAHEIAHVINKDGLNAVKTAEFSQAALDIANAEARTQAFQKMGTALAKEVLEKGYSQSQETAADSQAVRLVMEAGYDPRGFVRFLKRMEEKQRSTMRAFSTHPGIADRIARSSAQIGAATGGAALKERFEKNAAVAKF